MEEFYQTLTDFLRSGNPICEGCQSTMWIGYSDGHMYPVCVKCDHYLWDLNPAPYVTTQPVPVGELPEQFECRDSLLKGPSHETKLYRLKAQYDWTNVPPAKPGWYWLRHMCLDDELIEVVHVKHKYSDQDAELCFIWYGTPHDVDTPDFPGAYWRGPLEQPAFKEPV